MGVPHRGRPGRFGLRLTCCLMLAGLLAAGCDRLPASAVKQIRQGHRAYQRHQYAMAQQLLSPVISAHPGKPDVAEAHYVRGLARLHSGQAGAARRDFQAALRVADRSELRALIHAQLGNLDYEVGRYQAAARHYRRAEPDLPGRPPSDRVLLRYGISLQRTARFRQAKPVLAGLLARFPNGPVAAEARRRLTSGVDHFFIQCGVYSKQANAEATAGKLRAQGVEASAWRETRNGSTRYVVRAGNYPRRAQAEQALPDVRRLIPDAFIVP